TARRPGTRRPTPGRIPATPRAGVRPGPDVTAVIAAQSVLADTVLATAIFLVLFWLPTHWRDPEIRWHVTLWSAAAGAEALLWLLVTEGWRPSPWLFVAVFGAVALAADWRLWLEIRGRWKGWRTRWTRSRRR